MLQESPSPLTQTMVPHLIRRALPLIAITFYVGLALLMLVTLVVCRLSASFAGPHSAGRVKTSAYDKRKNGIDVDIGDDDGNAKAVYTAERVRRAARLTHLHTWLVGLPTVTRVKHSKEEEENGATFRVEAYDELKEGEDGGDVNHYNRHVMRENTISGVVGVSGTHCKEEEEESVNGMISEDDVNSAHGSSCSAARPRQANRGVHSNTRRFSHEATVPPCSTKKEMDHPTDDRNENERAGAARSTSRAEREAAVKDVDVGVSKRPQLVHFLDGGVLPRVKQSPQSYTHLHDEKTGPQLAEIDENDNEEVNDKEEEDDELSLFHWTSTENTNEFNNNYFSDAGPTCMVSGTAATAAAAAPGHRRSKGTPRFLLHERITSGNVNQHHQLYSGEDAEDEVADDGRSKRFSAHRNGDVNANSAPQKKRAQGANDHSPFTRHTMCGVYFPPPYFTQCYHTLPTPFARVASAPVEGDDDDDGDVEGKEEKAVPRLRFERTRHATSPSSADALMVVKEEGNEEVENGRARRSRKHTRNGEDHHSEHTKHVTRSSSQSVNESALTAGVTVTTTITATTTSASAHSPVTASPIVLPLTLDALTLLTSSFSN